MCRNLCSRFVKVNGAHRYCESCCKFLHEKYLFRETKLLTRLRCTCCKGLVRNTIRMFYSKERSAHEIANINLCS